MQKNKKKQKWSEEVPSLLTKELALLTELYPLYVSKKWKQIAENFKQKGFHRTQIECREKWINFLDPELNTNDWKEEELEKLYEIHDQVGTKWCVIQKYIGRTQNKIKNRFYGTLRNYVRFVVNYLQESEKSYNYEIGKLSPKFLNDMYKAENQFRFLNEEIRDTIFEMKFKVDRTLLAQKIKRKRNLYERLKGLIFKAFKNITRPKQSKEGSSEEEKQMSVKKMLVKEEGQPQEDDVQEIEMKEERPFCQFDFKVGIKEEPEPIVKDLANYYPFMNFPFQNYGFWQQ